MGWEGTDTEEVYSPPERIDPFPFTPEGRLYERLELELAEAKAVLRVGALVLEKRETQRKLNLARQGRRGPFPGLA
jgi:hypothetical protein